MEVPDRADYSGIRGITRQQLVLFTYTSPVLADAFSQQSVKNGSAPFSIGWILSDTTYSIRHLQSGDADVAITYSPAAESIAGDQGISDPKTYYLP